MESKNYIAFIVEGKDREPVIINNIIKTFFKNQNCKIITLSADQNIYMLWNRLKEDDFETDIIEVLREENGELESQLEGISRSDFSEVYLFFDYDVHNNNVKKEVSSQDALGQMLETFDNETDNGKLYVSYPMVEALRDFEGDECKATNGCFVSINELKKYKQLSAKKTAYASFEKYDFDVWSKAIDCFAMRLSCLMDRKDVIDYVEYRDDVNPMVIHVHEKAETDNGRIFILSAFPEFVVDYFGVKMWNKCVKHAKNGLSEGCE